MSRILFVAHRFGHPGGTEQTMKRYANTAVEMGHEVGVFATDLLLSAGSFYCGDIDKFTVTNDPMILLQPWDLIVVHGDGSAQNIVHTATGQLGGPVFYLLCRPDENLPVMRRGMETATWIGCATSFDRAFATKYGYAHKIVDIKGYPIECPIVDHVDRSFFNITKSRVYISCGGFWPHKQFRGIVEAFIQAQPHDTELILTGYDTRFENPMEYVGMGQRAGIKIQVFQCDSPDVIYDLMNVADLYIWNSKPGSEGYGLVLLESMFYNLPWIGTDTAGAHDLNGMGGQTYNTPDELIDLMRNPPQRSTDPNVRQVLRQFVVDNFNTKSLLTRIFSVL